MSVLVYFPCLSSSSCIVQRSKIPIPEGIPSQLNNPNCLLFGRVGTNTNAVFLGLSLFICCFSKYLRNKDCVYNDIIPVA